MAKPKGNLVVAQSGGPTAVINATVAGIVDEAMCSKEINRMYGARNGIFGVLDEEFYNLGQESRETLNLLRVTPSSALGSCRYKVSDEDLERILEVLKAHDVRYFLIAGGNDSMDTGNKVEVLARERGYDLRVIGAPKTVDNDLCYTDHCPGYGSVARWWAIAARDAGLDTEAIYTSDPVKILETMGRNSGWLTASTALAKEHEDDAPHLIYLPERSLIVERFLEDVERVYKRLGRVIIAVCEGIKNEKGETLVESKHSKDTDAFGHPQRGGASEYLSDLVRDNLGVKARWEKPGTIQRVSMVCVSSTDLNEAYMVGQEAVKRAVDGHSGVMVTLVRIPGRRYVCYPGLVRLSAVANQEKTMPEDYINEEGNFVAEEFYRYARPLIGHPLPEYARLRRVSVKKKLKPYQRSK